MGILTEKEMFYKAAERAFYRNPFSDLLIVSLETLNRDNDEWKGLGLPVLLVSANGEVPGATKREIARRRNANLYVWGDRKSIPDRTMSELEQLTRGKTYRIVKYEVSEDITPAYENLSPDSPSEGSVKETLHGDTPDEPDASDVPDELSASENKEEDEVTEQEDKQEVEEVAAAAPPADETQEEEPGGQVQEDLTEPTSLTGDELNGNAVEGLPSPDTLLQEIMDLQDPAEASGEEGDFLDEQPQEEITQSPDKPLQLMDIQDVARAPDAVSNVLVEQPGKEPEIKEETAQFNEEQTPAQKEGLKQNILVWRFPS